MPNNLTYPEIYMNLQQQTAIVHFFKKNGDIRVMLATRNLATAEILYGFLGGQLAGHDARCNIKNGNFAVIDLAIGEGRSFALERLVNIEFLGEITTKDELDAAFEKFNAYSNVVESTQPKEITLDMLD